MQLKASTDKKQNLEKILDYVFQAAKKGAKLVAFPEFMMFYTPSSQTPAQLARQAELVTGNFVKSIAACARENSIDIVGTFYEKSRKKHRVYDSSFLINSSGKLVSKYRKIHLYDALGFRESAKLAPGSKITEPTKSKLGRLGMQICYDLRFPEMSRALVSSGSDVLAAPSAWVRGRSKEDHWITINRTRAIENGCFLVSPDQTGNIYCGRSLVVDPYGRVLLDMKKRQGIGYADIDLDIVRQTRGALPLLKNRRTDIYPDLKL